MATDPKQIATAVARVQDEVPKLAGLKMTFGLELTAGGLMGPGETERFHVTLPGPEIEPGEGAGEKLRLSIPRSMFAVLAEEGGIEDWREAYFYKHLKVAGDDRVKRLIGKVIGGP